MLILLTSPSAIIVGTGPDAGIAKVLMATKALGYPTALVSNHAEPPWFQQFFANTGVQFIRVPGRQNGAIISHNAQQFEMAPYNALVLAATQDDIRMGKNGGAVLIAAGWSSDKRVQDLGIRVNDPSELQQVINLVANWAGQWWLSADAPAYSVKALADLSGYGKSDAQQVFAKKLTQTVKNGGANLNALLAITTRSLLVDGFGEVEGLVWGTYPSSGSSNDDTDVLSDFTHRLRTTVSRVRFARRGDPLFVRHAPSPKRSAGGGGDRTDPATQIETIHLNPFYAESGRLAGKHVVVVDDCTTYGVSFGVASALLRAAGAAAVTCVALGKFGNQLRYYEIVINSDPFAPIASGAYEVRQATYFQGVSSSGAQNALQSLIP